MKYKRAAEIVMRKRAATEGSSWARGHHKCGNAHLLRLCGSSLQFGSDHSSQLSYGPLVGPPDQCRALGSP